MWSLALVPLDQSTFPKYAQRSLGSGDTDLEAVGELRVGRQLVSQRKLTRSNLSSDRIHDTNVVSGTAGHAGRSSRRSSPLATTRPWALTPPWERAMSATSPLTGHLNDTLRRPGSAKLVMDSPRELRPNLAPQRSLAGGMATKTPIPCLPSNSPDSMRISTALRTVTGLVSYWSASSRVLGNLSPGLRMPALIRARRSSRMTLQSGTA